MMPIDAEAKIDDRTRQAIRNFMTRIEGQYDVAGGILFGSRARQDYQPDSDADLAVLLRGPHQRFATTKLAMGDIAFDVLLETGVNISPLPVWYDEWQDADAYPNPALLRNIAKDGFRV